MTIPPKLGVKYKTRNDENVMIDASKVGFAQGTTLKDALGGSNVMVGPGGQTNVSIPAGGAVILSAGGVIGSAAKAAGFRYSSPPSLM